MLYYRFTIRNMSAAVILLLAALSVTSCSESITEDTVPRNEGTTISVSANIVAPVEDKTAATSRTITTGNENYISNLHVLAFDAQGRMIANGYSDFSTPNPVNCVLNVGYNAVGQTVYLYGIANIDNTLIFNDHQLTKSEFENLYVQAATAEDLANGTYTIYKADGSEYAKVIGQEAPILVSEAVETTILANGKTAATINLVRQCAKVTLNIETEMDVFAYQLRNVPTASFLKKTGTNVSNPCFQDVPVHFQQTGDPVKNISFYVYENYAGNVQKENVTTESQRNYKIAPANASYINVWTKYPSLEGPDMSTMYRVYLGGIDDAGEQDLSQFRLVRNHNYVCNVKLKGDGSSDPRCVVGRHTPAIGDYLFCDGTWGPLNQTPTINRYPIAVIFANNPSATDRAAGYFHGYAVAIASAGTQLRWATENAYGVSHQVQDRLLTTLADVQGDLDGRTETNKIAALSDYSKINYPAAYWALNFGSNEVTITSGDGQSSSEGTVSSIGFKAPQGSSGWFLGSIGQYYLVAKNLGGNTFDNVTNSTWVEEGTKYWYVPSNTLGGSGVTSFSNVNREKVVSYFTAANNQWAPSFGMPWSSGQYDTWYWTSSEFSAANGFYVCWNYAGNFYLYGGHAKSYSGTSTRGVRPVIAF